MNVDRIKILLVDDEEVLVELIRETLEDLGYNVLAVTNSSDALRTFSTSPSKFDLVITDEKMPELSGTDLAEEILEIRRDIPIILYTDFPEISSEKRARAIGVRTILRKSSNMGQLVAYIRRLLQS